MALTIKQTKKDRSWTALLVEESERSLKLRNEQRKYTFRRMYTSVFVLVSAGFVLYCSLFYVGAFVDIGKIVGVSQGVRAQQAQKNARNMVQTKSRTLFSPIIEGFYLNRIYMRKGQSILATYSLPRNTELALKIQQCGSMPVIEVFNCNIVGEQLKTIRHRSTGFIEFTVSEAGFYYFDANVTKFPDTNLKLHHDYRVVWQRGAKQAIDKSSLPRLR